MSRAATASTVAYDLLPVEQEVVYADTELVRVIGVGGHGRARTSTYVQTALRPTTRQASLRLAQAEAYLPYLLEQEEARQATSPLLRPSSRFAFAVATAICLALLAVLAAPALAKGRAGDTGPRLRLSGYTDLSTGAAAPVIDATSGAAAGVPQPAPAAENLQAPPVPQATYEVVGPASISVGQIEAVLHEYGSPAAGKGQALYDLGVRYGIDPAYALAFFVHESACGTKGVARFTNSLGNIRWTEGWEDYEGYRKYSSWEHGMEDWYKLITELYIGGWGLRTVDQIIPVYAPAADRNHPPSYIASVKWLVDSWRGR